MVKSRPLDFGGEMATKDGKKTGGRKKGVPNKMTRDLISFLRDRNFNPAEKIVDSLEGEDSKLSEKDRCEIALKLMEFVYPKRKTLDASVEANPESLKHERLLEHVRRQNTEMGVT